MIRSSSHHVNKELGVYTVRHTRKTRGIPKQETFDRCATLLMRQGIACRRRSTGLKAYIRVLVALEGPQVASMSALGLLVGPDLALECMKQKRPSDAAVSLLLNAGHDKGLIEALSWVHGGHENSWEGRLRAVAHRNGLLPHAVYTCVWGGLLKGVTPRYDPDEVIFHGEDARAAIVAQEAVKKAKKGQPKKDSKARRYWKRVHAESTTPMVPLGSGDDH
jgi:hypothetical protein